MALLEDEAILVATSLWTGELPVVCSPALLLSIVVSVVGGFAPTDVCLTEAAAAGTSPLFDGLTGELLRGELLRIAFAIPCVSSFKGATMD